MIDNKLPSNRTFGFFFTFLLIFLAFYIKLKILKILFFFLATILLIISIYKPSLLFKLNKFWFNFGLLLNSIFSPIILILIYLITIAPISLIFLLFKKNKIPNAWIETSNDEELLKNKYIYQF